MSETEKKRGILKTIGTIFIELIKAIGKGELLIRLRVHKLLPYILYVFMLSMISIFMSYKAEQTMLKREKNKRRLETLQIFYAQKTCEIVSLDRISTVETLLMGMESELRQPEKPASVIKK